MLEFKRLEDMNFRRNGPGVICSTFLVKLFRKKGSLNARQTDSTKLIGKYVFDKFFSKKFLRVRYFWR